jgi:metal-responsive CopG/Arc/MetJ family transcriptional regulator
MGATRVTLTLPDDLLAVIDRFVAGRSGTTRSGVCAEALREWVRARQEEQIVDYYATMTDEEREEDAAWAALATRDAVRRAVGEVLP